MRLRAAFPKEARLNKTVPQIANCVALGGAFAYDEVTAKMSSPVRPEDVESRSLALLRGAGLVAVLAGPAGSIALLFRASEHPPPLLLALFVIWVLSPFAALGVAHLMSRRWSILTRTMLYAVMLVVSLGTLAVYGDDALGRRTAHAAFVYVLVPPVSLALIASALSIAGIISGRRSCRGDGV